MKTLVRIYAPLQIANLLLLPQTNHFWLCAGWFVAGGLTIQAIYSFKD